MEKYMKYVYLILFVWALFTFWPLIVLLLISLGVYVAYQSWKTKKILNNVDETMNSYTTSRPTSNVEVFEAEYTEKEVPHE